MSSSRRHRKVVVETHIAASLVFRQLLSTVDPGWGNRPAEEQEQLVGWYTRTARGIARTFGQNLRDPCHDAADVLQEILLKLFLKFRDVDSPHELLTERPCIRNLMEWKGLDRVDWENASRRSAKRRAPLPEADFALCDRKGTSPDHQAELIDEEQAFGRTILNAEDRRAYRLFRAGRRTEEIARALGRKRGEVQAIRDRLCRRLWAKIRARSGVR
jgi:DNA-directed RNA polymerase specialized sigma24 family protein